MYMQCSELEFVFEQEGIPPLAPEAREHLASCSSCKQFVAEVTSIVALAHQLPAEVDPPEHLWISIRAELERESVIRVAHQPAVGASWWESFADLFRSRLLAGAAVAALVMVAAGVSFRTPDAPMGEPGDDNFNTTVSALRQQEHDLANMQLASTNVSAVDTSLRQNLQQVDEFIADCEHRVHEVPSDELTREYLTNAYQQKAQLLSAMMDRGGSLN
jgi:hypothetical protein